MPTSRIAPAVVYVGPTIAREVVAAALPGADIRPPIQRGDLHRDRHLRYSLFVIIDGVFFQEDALPPREVIDVIQDGAIVIGAASLGALRAAELGPIGMRGAGTIYRLYRRGLLVDEDEVAVLFDPQRPHPPLSTALVDIRWAIRQALRHGTISNFAAQTLLEQAKLMPFPERSWKRLGCSAAVPGLKERDARHLLHRVQLIVKQDPSVLRRGRRSLRIFSDSQAEREAQLDPWAGIHKDAETEALNRWLQVHGGTKAKPFVGTGEIPADLLLRYRAFRDGLAAARTTTLKPKVRHRIQAETALTLAHGATDWASLCRSQPVSQLELEESRNQLALIKALREHLFTSGAGSLRLDP